MYYCYSWFMSFLEAFNTARVIPRWNNDPPNICLEYQVRLFVEFLFSRTRCLQLYTVRLRENNKCPTVD